MTSPRVYYSEWDPFAAAWLAELMKVDAIPAGDIDTRDLAEVSPDDLKNYDQVHLCAGIGGWAYALRLAGWGDRRVWSASFPCQPFSAAGKQQGTADKRHLWPVGRDLIRACRPPIVFGEQVASTLGRDWWSAGVRPDLEGMGYFTWAAGLVAAGVGAPHIRQRLYWLADSSGGGTGRHARDGACAQGEGGSERRADGYDGDAPEPRRAVCGLADDDGGRQQELEERDGGSIGGPEAPCRNDIERRGVVYRLEHAESDGRQQRRTQSGGRGLAGGCGTDGVGDTEVEGRSRQPLGLLGAGDQGHWSGAKWLPCSDGKARRVEPGIFPLAYGTSGRVDVVRPGIEAATALPEDIRQVSRVGALRGAGNAIVPQVAAQFIRTWLDVFG